MTERITHHALVPHWVVTDYLRLGWMVMLADGVPPLAETIHGAWSVAMGWPCACAPVVPRREG